VFKFHLHSNVRILWQSNTDQLHKVTDRTFLWTPWIQMMLQENMFREIHLWFCNLTCNYKTFNCLLYKAFLCFNINTIHSPNITSLSRCSLLFLSKQIHILIHNVITAHRQLWHKLLRPW
jgi:hypothetical protein